MNVHVTTSWFDAIMTIIIFIGIQRRRKNQPKNRDKTARHWKVGFEFYYELIDRDVIFLLYIFSILFTIKNLIFSIDYIAIKSNK